MDERFLTHEVENQPPPLGAYNAWRTDTALQDAVRSQGGGWAESALDAFGAVAGDELMALGYTANENKPKLRAFDRFGHRIDEVEFHPAYHRVMQLGMQHGVHAFAWRHAERSGAHVARAALSYLHAQAESGTGCPLTMTHAAVPTLRHAPQLASAWLPKITATDYDPRLLPFVQKNACTIGMGMTEKQGGSDVRANSSFAERQSDGSYRIVGHKWFFSAPMSDAWLVLAYTEAGITCFLMPKLLPDGARNAIHIQRLKDKLGDWSNASSEVEFHGAWAQRVGDEGRGVATILEMVALTRLDCMIGSSALMRQATVQAIHHTQHRHSFGKRLADHALMRNVLADLALESEASVALTMRVARAVDASARDASEAALARIATAIGKYWICKRAPPMVNEAQECLGGAGYIEESNLARLYRQAPLNSIWEGCGNIQCLDVLRALHKEPETRDALFDELELARGGHPDLDQEIRWLTTALGDRNTLELRSRLVVERMALALQAATLIQAGQREVADTFCATRLGGEHGLNYGTLPAQAPLDRLWQRAAIGG
ncbi:isovaleryl-CoA dehydrogenase [Sinimarinibacterium sp. NLF-5-8]|uniref:isovaleryl-CoA dehydrogenase n=1 Tax=Sinimarinibacterium sp. NLF-5-8 TaxID=2698684 RepID=UPI00137BC8EB|nr:isovaleryl-CoA dehydrogenase [Sinimarinibacterium sp. NLF-5-8]QHS09695.1 isovaleryl-CoA dehydrogenase [Sinimarinibacterium sp. NLF-5-8]